MGPIGQGRWADAVDFVAAAAVHDIQNEAMTMLSSAAGAGVMGVLYEHAFAGAGLAPKIIPVRRPEPGSARRVLYVIPGLSPGQAATDRLLNVVERHDRSRWSPMVLCAEEFTARTPVCERLQWPHAPSAGHGVALERLRAAGVPVTIAPTSGSYLSAGAALVRTVREMSPDIAVFIASPACPVQGALAFARVAPVQINQNIGSPLVIHGIDAVIYRNARRADADAEELVRRGVRPLVLPVGGIDLEAAERAEAIGRSTIGIPENAKVLVTLSNRLPERITLGGFGADLARFLARHPDVWWLAIGRGEFGRALAPFGELGVRDRVVLAGPRADVFPWLKAGDAYVNEYPEGGSNAVMEAMACGLPAVAMNAGDGHCESIGAEITGDPVERGDRRGFWSRASELCGDAGLRARVAGGALARAREQFGFGALVSSYERCYDEALRTAGAGAG